VQTSIKPRYISVLRRTTNRQSTNHRTLPIDH